MAPYEALYERRCRSLVGWFEAAEVPLIGPELFCEALEKVQLIRERMKMAKNRQKSYSNKRHRDLELMVGDKVFLKVSPMKGVMRFGPSRSRRMKNRSWAFALRVRVEGDSYVKPGSFGLRVRDGLCAFAKEDCDQHGFSLRIREGARAFA
nr:uncharacterized protein LOC104121707 [Nicotiana tomentosiformis]